jgi:hypothetical protein
VSLSSLSAVLAWHHGHYPLLRAQDIYKLIHQGVFGPGHIIAGTVAARRALEAELAAMEVKGQKAKVKRQDRDEELFESIDPENRLVRVNLRPLFGQGGCTDMEWLLEAMIESARRVKGDADLMKRRLAAAVRWCRKNLPRQAAELDRIAARAEERGYPAFHHSAAYARAYRPAYRVILRSCLSWDLGVNHQDTKSQGAG